MDVYTALTREEATTRIQRFAKRFEREYPRAVTSLTAHQAELLTFYDFPREHWKSLRTTNPIESIFDMCGRGHGQLDECGLRAQGYTWCFNSSGRPKGGGDVSTRRTSSSGS